MKRAISQRGKSTNQEHKCSDKLRKTTIRSEKSFNTVVCSHAIFQQAVSFYMALRAEDRPTSGLPVFWQDAATEMQHEWIDG